MWFFNISDDLLFRGGVGICDSRCARPGLMLAAQFAPTEPHSPSRDRGRNKEMAP